MAQREADYEPTPEQIREACQAIQAGWSEAEELARRLGIDGTRAARAAVRYEFPVVAVSVGSRGVVVRPTPL